MDQNQDQEENEGLGIILRVKDLEKEIINLLEENKDLNIQVVSLGEEIQKKEEKLISADSMVKNQNKQIEILTSEKEKLEERINRSKEEVGRVRDLLKEEKGVKHHILQSVKNLIKEVEEFDEIADKKEGNTRNNLRGVKVLLVHKGKSIDATLSSIQARIKEDFPELEVREYELKKGDTFPDADVYLRLPSLKHGDIYLLERKIPKDIIFSINDANQASSELEKWLKK